MLDRIKTNSWNRKLIYSLLLIIIILSSLATSIFAIGISPGKASVHYEPGLSKKVDVDIYNNKHKEFTAALVVEGELADYITLSTNEISFDSNDDKRSFSYTIKLPDGVVKPGIMAAEIKVVEKLDADDDTPINVRANVAVKTKLYLNVPYPGVYAEGNLKVPEVTDENEDVNFFVSIFNLGKDDISKCYAELEIYDPDGNIQRKLETEAKAVLTKQMGELLITIPKDDLLIGYYKVKGRVYYEGNVFELPQNSFKIPGNPIKLVSVEADDYTYGDIAKFYFLVTNVGNKMIEDLYTRLLVESDYGTVLADVKSYNIDIEKGETKETVAYWDTKNIDMGEYYGDLKVEFDDEVMSKDIKLRLDENKIEVKFLSPTGQVTTDVSQVNFAESSVVKIFGLIVVMLLIALLVVNIKNMKKKE